jgi:DNA-binding transcriptional ArsR family regulator
MKKQTVSVITGKVAAKNGIVPFAQLPNWIMGLPISGDAKIIYCFLHSLALKFNNNVFPSYETIAGLTGVSIRSISNHLKTLEAMAAITRQQRRNKQKRTSNLYLVNFIPPENLEYLVLLATSKAWKPGEIESL